MVYDQVEDRDISLILSRATLHVPFEIDAIQVSDFRGNAIRRKIVKLREHHGRVRAYILAQAKCPTDTEIPSEAEVQEELSEEAAQRLLEKLRSPWNRNKSPRTGHGPKRLDETFTKLQLVAQKHPIHPKLRRLVVVTKALERYNEHTRKEIRELEEQKNALDASGMAREKMPAVSKKMRLRLRTRTRSLPLAVAQPLPPSNSPTVDMGAATPPGSLAPKSRPRLRSSLSGNSVIDRSRDPRLRGREGV